MTTANGIAKNKKLDFLDMNTILPVDVSGQPVQTKSKGDAIKYLTTTDVMRELGVSHSRVLQLIRDGRLKGERLGRDWLFTRTALDAVRVRNPPGRPRKSHPRSIVNLNRKEQHK